MALLKINTCEIPLMLRRLSKDTEDPALGRARRYLEKQRRPNVIRHDVILDVLSALWRAKRRAA